MKEEAQGKAREMGSTSGSASGERRRRTYPSFNGWPDLFFAILGGALIGWTSAVIISDAGPGFVIPAIVVAGPLAWYALVGHKRWPDAIDPALRDDTPSEQA